MKIKKKGHGINMNILRGDRLILTKEYDKMKMVGAAYEVANITETSVVMRDAKTKIAVAALPIDIVEQYFERPENVKGWLPWTQIVGERDSVIAFYRTNGRKVQVRTINNIRSEASCHGDEFNLFFGIRLAYLRCQQKVLNNNEEFLYGELKKVANFRSDNERTMKKMMDSLEK